MCDLYFRVYDNFAAILEINRIALVGARNDKDLGGAYCLNLYFSFGILMRIDIESGIIPIVSFKM